MFVNWIELESMIRTIDIIIGSGVENLGGWRWRTKWEMKIIDKAEWNKIKKVKVAIF